MRDYNSAPSRGFIWGAAIATLIVVVVLTLIFRAVTPAGPAVSAAGNAAPTSAASASTAAPATDSGAGTPQEALAAESTADTDAGASGASGDAQADAPAQDRADVGGTAQASAAEETQAVQVAFTGDTGAALYVQACQSCHMPEGRGAEGAGRYPALANNQRATSTAYVTSLILNGNGGMPGFGHYLDDGQIALIVNYVRGDLNGQASDVQPQEIEELRPENPDYMLFGEGAG